MMFLLELKLIVLSSSISWVRKQISKNFKTCTLSPYQQKLVHFTVTRTAQCCIPTAQRWRCSVWALSLRSRGQINGSETLFFTLPLRRSAPSSAETLYSPCSCPKVSPFHSLFHKKFHFLHQITSPSPPLQNPLTYSSFLGEFRNNKRVKVASSLSVQPSQITFHFIFFIQVCFSLILLTF